MSDRVVHLGKLRFDVWCGRELVASFVLFAVAHDFAEWYSKETNGPVAIEDQAGRLLCAYHHGRQMPSTQKLAPRTKEGQP